MKQDGIGLGRRRGAVEAVGQDQGDALVGQCTDGDVPGRGGLRPAGVEPAIEARDAQAGSDSLLWMRTVVDDSDDEPPRSPGRHVLEDGGAKDAPRAGRN